MANYFVSRHPGACAWARARGLEVIVIEHLDPAIVGPGDCVLGTLPVHLAAQVCAQGGRYFHLSLSLPRDWRGRELSAPELDSLAAELVEFDVRRVKSVDGDRVAGGDATGCDEAGQGE